MYSSSHQQTEAPQTEATTAPALQDHALSPYGNQASIEQLQQVTCDPALAGKFEVIADDAQPTRANQVTASQLRELSDLCARIRNGESSVRIEPLFGWSGERKAEFRTGVMDDIGSILQTAEGRTLLCTLAAGDPYDDRDVRIGPSSAPSCVVDDTDAAQDPLQGSGSQVGYLPGVTDHAGETLAPEDEWAHMRSDVTLFHELTHAYHAATGTYQPDKVTADDGVPEGDVGRYPRDELATVGLGAHRHDPVTENAYRAARRGLAGGVGERAGDHDMVQRERYSRVHG